MIIHSMDYEYCWQFDFNKGEQFCHANIHKLAKNGINHLYK